MTFADKLQLNSTTNKFGTSQAHTTNLPRLWTGHDATTYAFVFWRVGRHSGTIAKASEFPTTPSRFSDKLFPVPSGQSEWHPNSNQKATLRPSFPRWHGPLLSRLPVNLKLQFKASAHL